MIVVSIKESWVIAHSILHLNLGFAYVGDSAASWIRRSVAVLRYADESLVGLLGLNELVGLQDLVALRASLFVFLGFALEPGFGTVGMENVLASRNSMNARAIDEWV